MADEQLLTKVDMEELPSPVVACGKAFKDGTAAVHAISLATVVMATSKENKIPLQLVQVKETNIVLTLTKHPETSVQKSYSIAVLNVVASLPSWK